MAEHQCLSVAANGASICDVSNQQPIPSDLVKANCVPPGFMVQSGWEIVCDYYQNVDAADRCCPEPLSTPH